MHERQHCPNGQEATTSGSPRTGFYRAQSSDCVRAVGNHAPFLGLHCLLPCNQHLQGSKSLELQQWPRCNILSAWGQGQKLGSTDHQGACLDQGGLEGSSPTP